MATIRSPGLPGEGRMRVARTREHSSNRGRRSQSRKQTKRERAGAALHWTRRPPVARRPPSLLVNKGMQYTWRSSYAHNEKGDIPRSPPPFRTSLIDDLAGSMLRLTSWLEATGEA
eukprot:359081-Chlamydomonas_euryale.AAC.7